MKLTDELLLKYADGLLAADVVAEVEKSLLQDAVAGERLRLMRVSGAALNVQARKQPVTPEVDPLKQSILAGTLDAPTFPNRSTFAGSSAPQPAVRNHWGSLQIAASIALLIAGLGIGYLARGLGANETQQLSANPTWLIRIVDYHTLYVRETVAGARANAQTIAGLKIRFETILGHRVTIPNLDKEQLEFRRGQYLKFEDSPIIQLAYLPKGTGRPVALCLKASKGPDTNPSYSFLNGLGVMRWHQGGLDYVLVGDVPEQRLRSAANDAQAQIGKRQSI